MAQYQLTWFAQSDRGSLPLASRGEHIPLRARRGIPVPVYFLRVRRWQLGLYNGSLG